MMTSSIRLAHARIRTSNARTYSTIRFPEAAKQIPPVQKPTIGQFKNPLLHTFLVASSACLLLHAIWLRLELAEQKQKLSAEAAVLEHEIQHLVDTKKQELVPKRKWYHLW